VDDGLGSCQSELSARSRAARVGVGILVIACTIVVAACFSLLPFFVASTVTRLTSTAVTLALIATGVVMIRRASPPRVDRVLWHSGGGQERRRGPTSRREGAARPPAH
jgi:hypothetical protein